jgi:hypothetical protein
MNIDKSAKNILDKATAEYLAAGKRAAKIEMDRQRVLSDIADKSQPTFTEAKYKSFPKLVE